MSFIGGFMDQYNRIQDRNLRKELLMEELGAKQREKVLALAAKAGQRSGVAAGETNALQALRARLGDAEGAEEYLATVGRAGKASDIMGAINELELDDPNKELNLRGNSIIDNFTVYTDPENGASVKFPTPQEIMGASLEELRTMETDLMSAAGRTDSSFVDINPQGVFSGSNKVRSEAMEQYSGILTQTLSGYVGDNPSPENANLMKDLNDLSSDNAVTASRARGRLMRTPEGYKAYLDMVNSDIPSHRAVSQMPEFDVFRSDEFMNAIRYYNGWDTLTPENQQKVLRKYPMLQNWIR